MYLARYHDVTISTSGVWRILKRLGMNRLPASARYQRRALRWKRYEKQRPGHQLQVDVKFIEPLGQTGGRPKKYYQFTVIDDCTRLRVLRAYPRCDQKTAIAFVDHVLAKLPFQVERVQTDNGSEFGTSFHLHLLDLGVDHVKIKPRTPRLNGKVERSHRIDSEEFYRLLQGQVIDDANVFTEKLQEWEDYYNYHRPHGALNRPNTLRTPPAENPRPAVIGLRHLHTIHSRCGVPVRGAKLRKAIGTSNALADGIRSAGGEEGAEEGAAVGFQYAPADIDAMVQPGVADDIPEGGNRSGLGVVGAEDQPANPREH